MAHLGHRAYLHLAAFSLCSNVFATTPESMHYYYYYYLPPPPPISIVGVYFHFSAVPHYFAWLAPNTPHHTG